MGEAICSSYLGIDPPVETNIIVSYMILGVLQMILSADEFQLEDVLGGKVPWRLLRVLLGRPYLNFSPTALAEALDTSRASVLRVLDNLEEHALTRDLEGGRYQANTEHELIRQLWALYNLERRINLQPEFKNAIDMFFASVEDAVEVFIVFGSVARGMATERSDIDVCVVGEEIKEHRFDFLPQRFEIHNYQRQDMEDLADFVVLDSVLNGIVLKGKGFVFDILKGLQAFPKEYLVYRLNKAKQFYDRAAELEGEAKDYYKMLANVAVGEVDHVLHRGATVSRWEMEKYSPDDIPALEEELAREGGQVWLT